MQNILKIIKKEFFHVLPAVVYFFISISLIELTFGRMLREGGAHAIAFAGTVVAAIIVGKVLVLVDHLPFINAFPGKPMMYNVFWKAGLYSFFCFLARAIEHLAMYVSKYKNFDIAWQHSLADTSWEIFWTTQAWFFVLFFVFVSFQEIKDRMGPDEFRRVFFGKER